MYKLLIVDDEIGIRQGLEHLLDWDEYNIAIVGSAGNGEEALVAIDKHKPHIMISDIRMPRMDGIELMKELYNRQSQLRVIVLSGYDDFVYVKEAMKYGAENYLLKPVDKEELTSSVKLIIDSLESDLHTQIHNRESMQILRNNTLARIVRNDISVKEYIEKTEFLGIDLNYPSMHVAVIELGLNTEAVESPADNQWKKYASLNICEEIIAGSSEGLVFLDPADYIVIIFRERDPEIKQERKIEEIISKCMDQISSILRMDCFGAVGSLAPSYRDLGISYRQAVSCLDYKLAFGHNKIAFYMDTQERKSNAAQAISVNQELLKDCLRTRNLSGFTAYVRHIFDMLYNDGNISPGLVRDIAIEIVITMLNVTREFKHVSSGIVDIHTFSIKLQSIKTVTELLHEIERIASNAILHIQLTVDKKYSKSVEEALQHIKENYASPDISLKTLAAHLNINAAYLGRSFKEETGEFFSDYLTKLRIEKAKHLLATTQLRINEISNSVGISNSNYFFTIFKKHTGMNPGDYRQV